MSITRAATTTYLATRFASLAAEAKQPLTDATPGFAPALDSALRKIGVADSALTTYVVADAEVPGFLALADYYALLNLWTTLATRSDVNARAVLGPRAQIFQHVKDLIAEASERCATYGFATSGLGSWEVGLLTTDYIEPRRI